MKIKDIQIDGFGVWTGLSVDSMNEGMTLFYGPNEAGKTTLMQFLRAMLYGFTPERRTRYLPPVYGGTPGGAIRVTGPGGGYEIRRHSQLTDADTTGQLAVTGNDGLSQGQHRLQSLLGGIDEPIFSNVFAIGIRELQELSSLDDTSAADELYKLSSGLDRVSLVDVMRSLRAGRGQLVGRGTADSDEQEAAANKLTAMMTKREKLRDEIQRLSGQTRRWSELATQRRTQAQEIESLRERMTIWEREARCVEIATGVFEPWTERETVSQEIDEIRNEASLPDEAPLQLVQIEAMIEDRRGKVDEIKNRRRGLRDKAEQLPVNKRLFDLQGRIEAATEQATWVEALQEQIARLDVQIEKARKQVEVDADRLGIDEHERRQIADGDFDAMPDLSRQTLSSLAGPSKDVKEQMFLLKQYRAEGKAHKVKVEKYSEKLRELLQRAHSNDLQHAIKRENDNISSLRERIQLGQHLDKLVRQYRELEQESIELTTDEAVPIDRLFVIGLPFIFGGMLLLYGLFNVFQITMFVGRPNPTQGMMCILFGAMALLIYYLSRERSSRSTMSDLEDCERQIESVRRQIREVELEREDIDAHTPSSHESLEGRLRESQVLLEELEAALPTYHAHEAANQSYKASYRNATKAAEGLKEAKRDWTATLDRLGLSTTLSPKSVRTLGDGYETLQTSIRRLNDLRDEREQRNVERKTIAKRIESLYLEALDASDSDPETLVSEVEPTRNASRDRNRQDAKRNKKNRNEAHRTLGASGYEDDYADVEAYDEDSVDGYQDDRVDDRFDSRNEKRRVGSTSSRASSLLASRSNPLDQLNHLHEELARQQHWIKQRRSLKSQDAGYKKQQAAHAAAIERGEQQRRALWAKCGVATPEQFYQIVDRQSLLAQHQQHFNELDKQIRTMIGTSVNYDDVAREIEGAKATDLERRWDALTTRMSETETRIAGLQTAQGELAASMKQLGDDDRLMTARLELGCVERQLNQLARRWQTLATASCLLEDVCNTVENERQPETLREASSFLHQLTDGKYTRIWTPLGSNQLKIDDHNGKSLPLEVLSRGTGEAVFIALRLSLAAAYSRRGVMLPLILDDVLVNFDGARAEHAARTLQTFAELGHQVMMFTCHDHIVDIFHQIGVEVREMPAQGTPGRAHILTPPEEGYEEEYEEEVAEEVEEEYEEVAEVEPEPEPEPAPVVVVAPAPQPLPVMRPASLVVEDRPIAAPRPRVAKSKYRFEFQRLQRQHRQKRAPKITIQQRAEPSPKPAAKPRVIVQKPAVEVVETREVEDSIGWAWFQRDPADGRIDADEAAAEAARGQWVASDEVIEETDRELESSAADPSWW